jgi:NADP-dependent 3-hydroxy acid dehydrogenase YdfG
MSSISFTDKVVFITGASSGIGEACAKAFAALGAKLVLCARRYDRLEKLAASLNAPAHLIQLDVTDRTAVEKALAAIPTGFRDIDVLVNNAGLSRGMAKFQDGLVDDWEEVINANVKACFMSRALSCLA